MPIVRLTYKIPEEREEFELAINGSKYKRILEELDNMLRSKVKYEDIETVNIQELREWLRNEEEN